MLYKASEEEKKIQPPEKGHMETTKTEVSDAIIFNSEQEEKKVTEDWID